MIDPDAQLAVKCREGDRLAFELLFRKYVDRVWKYGWFVTRSRESAAEIVQETFLRVAKSIARFEGRSSFSTWLFALTRSAAVEHVRQAQQQKRLASPVFRLVPPEGAVAEGMTGEESREAVRQAVAELPAAQRDAVILCEFLGMSIVEAAGVLGWGQSRVKVTLFRARRGLREMLQEFVAGDRSEAGAQPS
jgi:RNA polymerase sigma-70 factor (ECF subfamily)